MKNNIGRSGLFFSLISLLVVSGCSSVPDKAAYSDPSSPYYKINSRAGDDHSSKFVSRNSPINRLDGSLHSRLWQHFQNWKGTPYQYGGNSRRGIDCSAFVQLTLNSVANVRVPRTTRTQIHVGQPVSLSRLTVGDVVFFKTAPGQLHNGIYMGNRKFMHASSSVGVTVSYLDKPYWNQRYYKSIRVIS